MEECLNALISMLGKVATETTEEGGRSGAHARRLTTNGVENALKAQNIPALSNAQGSDL